MFGGVQKRTKQFGECLLGELKVRIAVHIVQRHATTHEVFWNEEQQKRERGKKSNGEEPQQRRFNSLFDAYIRERERDTFWR